jgi:DnaJ-class molecular chaperone
MPSYFRRWPADEDPSELLRGENMASTPWGAPDHGPCDKCAGEGSTRYRCRSCLERGADESCPACGGRVEFVDICPTCEGNGEIDRTVREGVSVFPSIEGLRRYLAERDVDTAGCGAVVLEGELTGDVDLDADAGALLIWPGRVVGLCPLD